MSTLALSMVALAILLGTVGSRSLGRAGWPTRSPALGIATWLMLQVSVVSSLFLAGAALAVPQLPWPTSAANMLDACGLTPGKHYGALLLAVVGAVAASALLFRLGVSLARLSRNSRRTRREQLSLLRLVSYPFADPDVAVLAHPVPAAYCIPGRGRQVVVTQGAISALSPSQLDQILAHERAHLRARHHLVLTLAAGLDDALGGRLGSGRAHRQVEVLAEMHADDAAGPHRRRELADAVLALASAPGSADAAPPAGMLAATGAAALDRVRRLAGPADPLPRSHQAGIAGLIALLPLLPILTTVVIDYCALYG